MAERGTTYEIDTDLLVRSKPDSDRDAGLSVTFLRCPTMSTCWRPWPAGRSLAQATVLALNPQSLGRCDGDLPAAGRGPPHRWSTAHQLLAASLCANRRGAGERRPSVDPSQRRTRVAMVEWIEPLDAVGQLGSRNRGHSRRRPARSDRWLGEYSPYVKWEALLAYDPEVIVIVPCGFDLARTVSCWQPLAAMSGWQQISAVPEPAGSLQSTATLISTARECGSSTAWSFGPSGASPARGRTSGGGQPGSLDEVVRSRIRISMCGSPAGILGRIARKRRDSATTAHLPTWPGRGVATQFARADQRKPNTKGLWSEARKPEQTSEKFALPNGLRHVAGAFGD